MPSNAAVRAVVGNSWESAANAFESDSDALSFAFADDDAWTAFADRSYSGLTGASLTRSGAGAAAPPTSPPYSAIWIGANGAWENPANWTVTDPGEPAHSLPGADDAVAIGANGASGDTVTLDSIATIWSLVAATTVTLDIQAAATLTITHTSGLGGVLDVEGNVDFAPGVTLILAGDGSQLSGAIAGGIVDVTGTVTQFKGACDGVVDDNGTIVQTDVVSLNGRINIETGGVYQLDMYQNAGAIPDINGGTIDNAGTFMITKGTGPIAATFVSTGTLDILAGVGTYLYGSSTLTGTITGGGGFDVASTAAHCVIETSDITIGQIEIEYGGTLSFNRSATFAGKLFSWGYGLLDVASNTTLTLSGDTSDVEEISIGGGGTINVTGAAAFAGVALAAGTTIVSEGAVNLGAPYLYLDPNGLTDEIDGELIIDNGATVTQSEGQLTGSGEIYNAGTFIHDERGAGNTTTVTNSFINAGRIFCDVGALVFKTEIRGVGWEVIDTRDYLQLDGQSTASQKILFDGKSAELYLADAAQFHSSIYDFGAQTGEAINLLGFDSNATKSFASASDGLIVNISDGAKSASLHLVGSYNQSLFQLNATSNSDLLTYSG